MAWYDTRAMAWRNIAALCVSASLVSGCSFFPTQGVNPTSVQSGEGPSEERLGYIVADLSPHYVDVLAKFGPRATGNEIARLRGEAPRLLFGTGDLVNVTIFEAAAGGLFIPSEAGSRSGNFVQLPVQEVDRAGTIQVPFAGTVQAAGRTPADVKATIEERLRNRAIEPQAIVTLQESRSTLVSVSGEANNPTRFALARSGDRILDAIARAGGSKWPPYETYVTLKRGSRTATAYYNRLLNDTSANVFLQPGDNLSLSRKMRSFLALGASGQNGFVNFEDETLTLSQAVGRSGGILDSRGDPAQTFLFRLEENRVAREMGLDVSQFPSGSVPVIYRVNLRDPQGYFLATRMPMYDKDILFVSNAQSVELTKFLQVVSLSANTVSDIESARILLKGSR